MAKVKAAKQRIVEYLKGIGKDPEEIKDVLAELDAADVDLEAAANSVEQNKQWRDWYQQISPALQEIISERDSYKERITKLEAAGLTFGDAQAAARMSMEKEPNSQAQFDPAEFRQNITRATNNLVKDVSRYGFRHFKTYNEELDLDAVEKIMSEKNIPFDVAYGLYEEPKREAKRQEEIQSKIKQGIQEGLQAEFSKQGIRKTRKRVDDIEPAPLDKAAPSDRELREAFVQDINSDVTH